jgi:hypothetical protein
LIEYVAQGGPLEDDGEYEEVVVMKKSNKHKRKAKEEKGSEKKREKKATCTRRSLWVDIQNERPVKLWDIFLIVEIFLECNELITA